MPTSDSPWHRNFSHPAFLAQGVLVFLTLCLSATSLALIRAGVQYTNNLLDTFRAKYDNKSIFENRHNDLGRYPYAISVIIVSSTTFMSSLVSLFCVSKRRPNPIHIIVCNALWAACWLALFLYGVWYWRFGRVDAYKLCDNVSRYGCISGPMALAYFILTPIELLATVWVLVIAIRAHRHKKYRAQDSQRMPSRQSFLHSGRIKYRHEQHDSSDERYTALMGEVDNGI